MIPKKSIEKIPNEGTKKIPKYLIKFSNDIKESGVTKILLSYRDNDSMNFLNWLMQKFNEIWIKL